MWLYLLRRLTQSQGVVGCAQLYIGPGRIHIHLYIGFGHDRVRLHIGPGRIHAQPHVGWTQPSLVILGCNCELDLFSPGFQTWIEPNVPQVGCVTEKSLYTEPPIPWVWINNYDAHHNLIKYEQVVHTYIN